MLRKVFIPSLMSVLIILLIVTYFISCRHDTVNLNEFSEIKFNTQVLPIFISNCAYSGCHDGSGEGENLSSYEGIIRGVVKGKPYSSRVYTSMISYFQGMPPNGPIGIKARSIIKLWIEQGARNTIDSTANPSDTTGKNDSTATSLGYACYSRDIEPIINSNCAKSNCHGSGSTDNFHLLNYYEVKNLVVPGQPNNSNLYQVITSSEERMPPSYEKPLTKANIDSIYSWIKQGAKNETCAAICDTSKFTFSGQVFPIISNYCEGCHSGNSPSGNITLKDYASISAIALNGKLVNAITGNGVLQMPPAGKLSDCKIITIKKWVTSGAPNNK